MSNWIAITIDTLYEAKVAKLIDACDSLALKAGQANRSPGIIQGVVTEIRRKIGSNKANRVDSNPATIPGGLRDMAVDLIIARLKGALDRELTEDERRQLTVHNANLNRIAEGKDVVEQADDPVTAPVQSGDEVQLVRPGRTPGGNIHPFSDV